MIRLFDNNSLLLIFTLKFKYYIIRKVFDIYNIKIGIL